VPEDVVGMPSPVSDTDSDTWSRPAATAGCGVAPIAGLVVSIEMPPPPAWRRGR
jgi:hypothetical protein